MASLLRFVLAFAAFGLIYPAAFTALADVADPYLAQALDYGRLLWPTSGLAWDAIEEVEIHSGAFTLAAASNAVLYGVIGAVVWSGIRKHLWLLGALAAAVGAGWAYMLSA